MRWAMVVSSKQVAEGGWPAEALRLRSFLTVISDCMPPVYGEPVVWRDEDLTAEQWSDLSEITAEVERQRLRSEDGSRLWPGGSSGGVVQAYRNGAPEAMINILWNVGGDGEWQFNAAMTFYDEDIAVGGAYPLKHHPVEWLVKLISAASASVGAVEARIETDELGDEVADARREAIVGEVTLAPHGIGDAKLPASIAAYPCTEGYPDGLVLVADLDRAADDPASLVDDLLAIDDILRRNSG